MSRNALAARKTICCADFNSPRKKLPLCAATGAAGSGGRLHRAGEEERRGGGLDTTPAHGGSGLTRDGADGGEAIATLQEAPRQAEQDKENAELANRQAKMREFINLVAAEYVCPLTRPNCWYHPCWG